jgi:hypothetical protein
MSPANLLAWDFVKMETELKIRAFALLFADQRPKPFTQAVQAVELRLAEQTEACHGGQPWPGVDEPADECRRLVGLLLALRRQAALHLGGDRGRPDQWLREYLFALTCYGVNAGRYDNLSRPELFGAYLSAGVAAARLLGDREEQLWADYTEPTGVRS